jgi:hypothetical protein
MRIETLHAGGFIAAAPAGNRAERWDTETGQYTAWNTAGVVTATRAFTPAEASQMAAADAVLTADTNRVTIEQRAQTALAANETFLAIASPSNAQNAAQIKLLTRECQGLIRLAIKALDSLNGT